MTDDLRHVIERTAIATFRGLLDALQDAQPGIPYNAAVTQMVSLLLQGAVTHHIIAYLDAVGIRLSEMESHEFTTTAEVLYEDLIELLCSPEHVRQAQQVVANILRRRGERN